MKRTGGRSGGEGGFTLLEMLIVVAVLGMVLVIVIPYFNTIMRRSRMDAAARQFQTILLSARLQAIRRGSTVGVTVSTDTSSQFYLTPTVFLDANGNEAYDTGETILSTDSMPPGSEQLKYSVDTASAASPTSTAGTLGIDFTPFGSGATGASASALYVLDTSGNVLQVSIPNATTGKIVMTKRASSGSSSTYVGEPWTWY